MTNGQELNIDTLTPETMPRFSLLENHEISQLMDTKRPELLQAAMAAERDAMARKTTRDGDMTVAIGTNTYTLRVSEKGAISVYGLGRMPATYYAEQWAVLGVLQPHLGKFIDAALAAGKIKLDTPEAKKARREAAKLAKATEAKTQA